MTDTFVQAQALHRAGRLPEAAALYRDLLTQTPDDDQTHEWYGMLCLQSGRGSEALEHLRTAARLKPAEVSYFENLAGAAMRLGQPDLAADTYQNALKLHPQASGLRRDFARLLCRIGHPGAAMDVLEDAVHNDPYLQAHCRNPDSAVTQEARHQIIVANCRHICARFPDYAPAHYALACSLMVLGQMADAVMAAETAIRINPTLPVYYHVAMEAGTPVQKAAALAALEKLKGSCAQMPPDGAAILHFLLFQAYDRAGRHADAFRELADANRIKRGQIHYDIHAPLAGMRGLAAFFPAEMCVPAENQIPAGPQPVFVLGMYRSGTSLVEQILASHPEVYGAGEVMYLPEVLRDAGAVNPAKLKAEDFPRIGQAYLDRLRACAPGARYIVDKLPDNFQRIGWIRRLLPGARILHVQRNPLDCCFSCFAHMFSGEIDFAYDQTELGQYYKAYQELMAHWRSVLPPDAMLEVSYEHLVESPDESIRKMLDFCGLPWNQACLSFNKTSRAVATASVGEVRQPLFRRSVGRAVPYARWLQPLVRALDQGYR